MSATDSCHAGAYPGFCLKSEDKKFLHYKKISYSFGTYYNNIYICSDPPSMQY